MQVSTAIRENYDGLVTTDKRILAAAPTIRAREAPTFNIFTPTQAVDWIEHRH